MPVMQGGVRRDADVIPTVSEVTDAVDDETVDANNDRVGDRMQESALPLSPVAMLTMQTMKCVPNQKGGTSCASRTPLSATPCPIPLHSICACGMPFCVSIVCTVEQHSATCAGRGGSLAAIAKPNEHERVRMKPPQYA